MRIDGFCIIAFASLFLLFVVGSFLLSLPFTPAFCSYLSSLLLNKPTAFFYAGLIVIVLFTVLIPFVFVLVKKPFFSVKMQSHTCVVDTNIISRWLQNYFSTNFPDKNVFVEEVILRKKKLEIIIKVPLMKRKELKSFLKKAQVDLASVLMENFRYDNDFILTLLYA